MVFEPTINLGHIITLVALLISFITWGQGVKWEMHGIKKRLDEIEKQNAQQTQLFIESTIMNHRLGTLESRLATAERKLEFKAEESKARKYPA